MSELCFDFTNIPEEFKVLYGELDKQYWQCCDDEATLENLVKSYKIVLINIVRFINHDISSILTARGIVDKATQGKINQHFIEHINSNIGSIVEPIINKYGTFNLAENTIIVNFLDDYKIVSNYMAEVHAHALDATIFELGKIMESHIDDDCKHLEEIYKIVRSSNDTENDVQEYIKTNDKTLVDKYGPIILMMKEFGFKSKHFRDNMQYFASNLSVEYSEIIRRYYTISLKKDKEFNRNMSTVNKFIQIYNDKLDSIIKHEKLVREECEKNKQEKYKSWIN